MKTIDFSPQITSAYLLENMRKQFGTRVNLEKYDREQLEDIRNKLRTRIFQQEGSSGVNDLLTNETYQKDKAMLELLNIRIKEMLGEDIKKLRDKMDQLSEAKKGTRPPKTKITAKGAKGSGDDKTGDGKKDFDDIQVARMTAGGVPKKKAIAKATSDNVKEVKMADLPKTTVKGKSYGNQDSYEKPPEDKRRPAATMPSKKDKKPLGEASKHPKDCDCKECSGMWEGNGDGNLANNAKPYDKVTRGDVVAGRLGKDEKGGKKKVKESINVFKHNVRFVNESIGYLLQEDEEGKAKTITAAGDMVNDFTSWMQRVGQYQTKAIIELSDEIRAEFGPAEAEAFKQAVGPALSATLETLTQQRESISNAVAQLASGSAPPEGMGMEPGMDPGMDAGMDPSMDSAPPDAMNPEMGGDEFGASDAAAGGPEASGRELRESKFARRLAESHSIMSKLAS